jgi:hypothetical protein
MQQNILSRFRLALTAFFSTDIGKAFGIAIIWQVTMTVIGALFDASLSNIFQAPSRPDGLITLLSHTSNWDSNWYTTIIHDAYNTNLASSVFYPLFPFYIWAIQTLSFGLIGTLQAGLILNTISLGFAILALVKISDFFIAKLYRWWVIAIFITSPAAIFLHLFYTEALFCALGFWSYLFALRKEWWKVGIILGLLTAVRLPSILFILLCGMEFLRAYNWKIKKIINKQLLWFLLAPLGFIVYGTYLYIIRHDFLAMFHGYSYTNDWSYHIFNLNIVETYSKTARAVLHAVHSPTPLDAGLIVNNVLPLLAIGILLLSAIYCLVYLKKGTGIPLATLAIASIVLFSVNSNIISVHRYILPCIVIYIGFIHFVSLARWRHYLLYVYLYVSVFLQSYLLILFTSSYFAG